jgi:hypothetical protein
VKVLPVFVYRIREDDSLPGGIRIFPTDWNPDPMNDVGADIRVMNREIDVANQILQDSGVNISLQWDDTSGLLRCYEGPILTINQVLQKVVNNEPPFNGLRAWRNEVAADLVSVWHTPSNNVCGKAETGPSPSRPFSVVAVRKQDCQFTFLHELGHLFGIHHDRYVFAEENPTLAGDPNLYNFGFVNVPAQKRTVMAYNKECADQTPPETCRRIPMMSTPRITHEGDLIGIAPVSVDAADDARWMNEQRVFVAGFR